MKGSATGDLGWLRFTRDGALVAANAAAARLFGYTSVDEPSRPPQGGRRCRTSRPSASRTGKSPR